MNWKTVVAVALVVLGVLHIFGVLGGAWALGSLLIGVGLLAL